MEKKTEWFDSTAERRAYIKKHRKEAKMQGKKLRVLKRSYCQQRCTGKRMYFVDFSVE